VERAVQTFSLLVLKCKMWREQFRASPLHLHACLFCGGRYGESSSGHLPCISMLVCSVVEDVGRAVQGISLLVLKWKMWGEQFRASPCLS
jgi:hypothetical protein